MRYDLWSLRYDNLARHARAGSGFNAANAHRYEVNEIEIASGVGKSGITRLDSYTFRNGPAEIVSRKNRQLAELSLAEVRKDLREFEKKYAVGMPIADTPKNRALGIEDDLLTGTYILEVPVQTRPVPQAVLDYARERYITIRDVEGNIYR
jgi:hypothetical protein